MLFDKNGWCLIPEAEWVEKFYKFNSQEQEWPFHEKFPKIEVIASEGSRQLLHPLTSRSIIL